jgi:DNA polymerase-3 subunit alpha
LGEADLMRRAMGKKKREEMAIHEQKFVNGAVERGIKREKAQQIFSLMAQFADYGFNRSHSVAYAYLAFQTAYLKAHYPEHFYAAVLSNELQDTTKVFKYSNELRGQGIRLLPPDVNESMAGFTPLKGAIRYGLAAIKGIGQSSVNAIIEARSNGRFSSFSNFVECVGQGSLNKRVLESLVCAGAFDSLIIGQQTVPQWRACLYGAIDSALARASRAQRNKSCGQNDLFGEIISNSALELADESLPTTTAWTHAELLAAEKSAIGFYISGHPLENFKEILAELRSAKITDLSDSLTGAKVFVGGIVTNIQVRTTKTGNRFALMRLEDETGGVKCVCWPEVFSKCENSLQDDVPVLATGKIEASDEGAVTIICEEVSRLEDILQRKSKGLIIQVPVNVTNEGLLETVFGLLDKHRGDCEVMLDMVLKDGVMVRVRPHGALRVRGSLELEGALRSHGCHVEWLNVSL